MDWIRYFITDLQDIGCEINGNKCHIHYNKDTFELLDYSNFPRCVAYDMYHGKLCSIRPYLDNKLHGTLYSWNNKDELTFIGCMENNMHMSYRYGFDHSGKISWLGYSKNTNKYMVNVLWYFNNDKLETEYSMKFGKYRYEIKQTCSLD